MGTTELGDELLMTEGGEVDYVDVCAPFAERSHSGLGC